jgi:hypothetical protein
VNETLNHFRAGVIAERQFEVAVRAGGLFGPEQWHTRCEHLAEQIANRSDTPGEAYPARAYGRLAVALFALEATERTS